MFRKLTGLFSSSQTKPANVLEEPASSCAGAGDPTRDEDEQVEGKEGKVPNPQSQEPIENAPSHQPILPAPNPKKPNKKGKKATTLPEVEGQPGEESFVQGKVAGAANSDRVNMNGDQDMVLSHGHIVGSMSKSQLARSSKGRFSKKERAAADKAQQQAIDKNTDMLNGVKSSEVSEKPQKAKKSRKNKAQGEVLPETVSQSMGHHISDAEQELPAPNSGKGKNRKAKAKPNGSDTANGGGKSNTVAENGDPEQTSQDDFIQASNQLLNDTLSIAAELEENADGAQQRPSKKALGKRKAIGTPTDSTKKSSKRQKAKGSASRDLRDMFSSGSGSRSNSGQVLQPDFHESLDDVALDSLYLQETARNLYAQSFQEESARKVSEPILPPGYPKPSRKDNIIPSFTPINLPRPESPERHVGSKERISTPAAIEQPAPHKGTVQSKKSQDIAESMEVTEPMDIEDSTDDEDGSGHNQPASPKTNQKRQRKRRSPLEESEDLARQSPFPAPQSGGKRKRRLPIDESELLTESPKKGSLKSASTNPKTPRKSKTPRPSSTPKASATRGRLPVEDVEAIYIAVENYRDMHGMTDFEINQLVQASATDGRDLWKEVYEMVVNIPKPKILSTARRRFHNFEARGTWTPEQDEELKDAYTKFPGKWMQIGQYINRFGEDCRDRWRNYLVCGNNMRKDIWAKDEEDKLKAAVKEMIETLFELKKHDASLRDTDPESMLDWNLISKDMGYTRSRLQCANKWKKLKEREAEDEDEPQVDASALNAPLDENVWRNKQAEHASRELKPSQKLEVLRKILESGASREGKIPWKAIRLDISFEIKTLTMKFLFRNLRRHIPTNRDMQLKDILQFLIQNYEAAAPDEPEAFVETSRLPDRKRRRRKRVKSAKNVSEEDNNGDGPSEPQKRRSRKISKYAGEEFAIDEREDEELGNGEGPSTSRGSKLQSVTPELVVSVEDAESSSVAEPKSKKRRKKPVSEEFVDEALPEQEEVPILPKKQRRPRPGNNESPIEDMEDLDEIEVPLPKKKRQSGDARRFILEEANVGSAKQAERDEVPDVIEEPFQPSPKHKNKKRKPKDVSQSYLNETDESDAEESEIAPSVIEQPERGRSAIGEARDNYGEPLPKKKHWKSKTATQDHFEAETRQLQVERRYFDTQELSHSPSKKKSGEVPEPLLEEHMGNGKVPEIREKLGEIEPISSKKKKRKSKKAAHSLWQGSDVEITEGLETVNEPQMNGGSEIIETLDEVEAQLPKKKKRKSKKVAQLIEELDVGREDEPESIEQPEIVKEPEMIEELVPKNRHKSKSKSTDIEGQSGGEKQPPAKKKKKLRQRMRALDESQSQDTTTDSQDLTQETNEDIASTHFALNNGEETSGKGKEKKLPKLEYMNEEKAINSDDEQPSPIETRFDENVDNMGIDQDQQYNNFGNEMDIDWNEENTEFSDEEPTKTYAFDANAEEMDIDRNYDQDETYIAQGGPQADSVSIYEQQDKMRSPSPSTNSSYENEYNSEREEDGLNSPDVVRLGNEDGELANGYERGGFETPELRYPDDEEDLIVPNSATNNEQDQDFDDETRSNNASKSNRESPPSRHKSPSLDLDAPTPNDGRRKRLVSAAKFGRKKMNGYRTSGPPSVSSGSDSSIPARVVRKHEPNLGESEGSIEL